MFASAAASGHVMVTYDHNQPRPAGAVAPHDPKERRAFFAMLAAFEQTLTGHGLTITNTERGRTVVWVQRPERSTRALIVLADEGFAWLPALTSTYQLQTRASLTDPWQQQDLEEQDQMLEAVELLLRRGLATAEAEDRAIYLTATDSHTADLWPYSRWLPLDKP